MNETVEVVSEVEFLKQGDRVMGRPKKTSRIWLTTPKGERIGIDVGDVLKLQRNRKLEITYLKLIDGRIIPVMEGVYQVLNALDAVMHPEGRDA